ncbi:hypothetical protein [Acetivibrio ethanolgignens]|uniref:DUF2812 domain-containing protein n=1 Tax=Acetivibrio ethanolgignens TaxID=290052 RepID=A0A0V8QG76_9FIRM|nr:hypothetical protein [Acetivibrio ethanolgignens]KSV59450.1 hypothetical protein ASU35_08980 [Acetivibrio ethanolgignens]
MKRMEVFHLLSCLGIADANYYYRGMAKRGWMLEKHNKGFDYFIRQENSEAEKLFAFPVGSTELSEQDMERADLKLLAKNKNYHIYLGDSVAGMRLFTGEHFGTVSILKLAALLVYPLACYYLLRGFSGYTASISEQWLRLLSLCTIGIIEICFLWSCIVDFLELRYIKKYNRLWERNCWRYGFSVALTYLANVAQLILIAIILYKPMLWSLK